jgi:hypothetical protein
MGKREIVLTIFEQDKAVKRIPLTVYVQPALYLEVGALRGEPGPAKVAVRVGNRSSKPLDGTLRLRLPKSWKADAEEVAVKSLKPDEVRSVECGLTWSSRWEPGETASVLFDGGGGRNVASNIIPARWQLHRVDKVALDGRDDDWPADTLLPGWLLGPTSNQEPPKVRLGWGKDGLYGLIEVAEADLENPDPRSFWTCNCLELFVDCGDNKQERGYAPGDHQFWFVPLVAEKRVYAGQWKRAEETPQTRYDLQGVQGVALAKGKGYVMEFKLPAAELKNFKPEAGRIGLSVNLTVKGKVGMKEAWWPAAKNSGIVTRPALWGSMELVD